MRQLTHSLGYDRDKHRWSCPCGYILGDGHEKLYARCPGKRAYPQTGISSKPNKAALDLFDVAPPKPKRKKHDGKT
jgi:hypothetical protein